MEINKLVLIVTNDCNLSCPYCFVKKTTESMNFHTAKASIDFLISNAIKASTLTVSFFGGEPLLMFDLIKKIITYSKEQGKNHRKRFNYGIITNGTLFTDEIIDFIWDNEIDLILSWDGARNHIVKIKGEIAYNQMRDSIRRLKERGIKLKARLTVDPCNIQMKEHLGHTQEVGFDSVTISQMNGTLDWTQEKADSVYMEIADYFLDQLNKGVIFCDDNLISDLLVKTGLKQQSDIPCGAGKWLYGITTDGKILPCQHPETWLNDFILGTVFEAEIDETKRKPFLESNKTTLINCSACMATSRCKGSCFKLSHEHQKNLLVPYEPGCIWTRARYKAVEKIYAEVYNKEKSIHLLKLILNKFYWDHQDSFEIGIPLQDLDSVSQRVDLKRIWFKLKEDELNLESGKKILAFLESGGKNSSQLLITHTLPQCIFGSEYKSILSKYRIPLQLDFHQNITLLINNEDMHIKSCKNHHSLYCTAHKPDNCTGHKQDILDTGNPDILLTRLFKYYEQKADITLKCKNCVYHARKLCIYCFFGVIS